MATINKKWEIELLGTNDNGLSAAEALAGGQASLVFIVLSLSTIAAMLVLTLECCWAKLHKITFCSEDEKVPKVKFERHTLNVRIKNRKVVVVI